MKQETVTLVLVNLAGIMERADEAILPSVYNELKLALHTDPTGLGSLTLFRSIVQCSCYPLAAYLSSRYNRAHVIALGAFVWALPTFFVAISSTFLQVAVSRGLNGVGLAIVIPSIQSLIADSTEESNRGTAFGWLQLTSSIGSMLGGFVSVLIASTSFMGIPGWRLAFHLVAFISVLVAILLALFADDPRYKPSKNQPFVSELKDLIKEAKMVLKIPSFQILIAQGVSGSFPWSALSFLAMWLELIGFSHKKTAFLLTLFTIGCSVGGLCGGIMGDKLAKHFPNSGRIVLSQISSASAIPLAAVLLLALPDDPSTAFLHGLVLFVMGICISWNGAATNSPIFAEIVPDKCRTSIYALDRSIESVLASFAPPIVGILAQHVYGYQTPKSASSADSAVIKVEIDRENAASLAKALYTAIGIPMVVCCFIYSFLYCSYPRDRERSRMNALIESEMLLLEEERSVSFSTQEEYLQQLYVSESSKEEERSQMELNDRNYVDENDNKALL